MSEVKYLKTKDILTAGNEPCRVVLDYDLGIVYNYHEPERITAVYESGAWHMQKCPYYSSGGWGSGTSGDYQGSNEYHNTKALLNTIGAARKVWNKPIDLAPSEYLKRDTMIQRAKALQAKANKLGLQVGANGYDIEPLKVVDSYKPSKTPKGINPKSFIDKMQRAVKVFIERKGNPVDIDGYSVTKDLVIFNGKTVAFYDLTGVLYMNAELLSTTNLERKLLGGESLIQSEIRKVANYSIPFNVLDSAGLALNETKILDQGPQETHQIKVVTKYGSVTNNTESRHFTGALLLENAGRKFLMDLDRRELEHGIWNAFFVEVSASASTIAEAYDSMKPQEVRDAETAGTKVLRQGEFFFIDTGETLEVDSNRVCNGVREDHPIAKLPHVNNSRISHGKGRPNDLMKPVNYSEYGDDIVCGIVTHSGREHAPLNLGVEAAVVEGGNVPSPIKFEPINKIPAINAWFDKDNIELSGRKMRFKLFKVVPNSTIGNFTIQGDID